MQGLDSFSPEIIWKCDDGQTVIFSVMKSASSSLLFAGGFSSAGNSQVVLVEELKDTVLYIP